MQRYNEDDPRYEQYEGYNQGNYNNGMNINVNGNMSHNVDNGFLGKVALVLSIISFVCCCVDWLFSIPAIICAVIAVIKNKKDVCAWAAIIISCISLGFYAIAMITGLANDITSSFKENSLTEEISAIENSQNEGESSVKSETDKIANSRSEKNTEVKYEIVDRQFYTFKNSINDVEYFFLMGIKNTGNCNIYLKECTIDLEDADGHLLQTGDIMSNCPSVIKPGEIGYFYNSVLNLLIDDNVDSKKVSNIVPHTEIVEATKDVIEYTVSDLSLTEEYGCAKVIGRVTNTSDEDDPGIYINAIFYNKDGKVIGISGTSVYDIKAGETVGFDISSMYMAGTADYSDIASYDVIAQADYYQW